MAIPSWSHKKTVEQHIQLKNEHKNWIDIFLKKAYKQPIGTQKKGALYHKPLGKHKSNVQILDITSQLCEWLLSKQKDLRNNLVTMWKKGNPCAMLTGM